MWFSCVQFKQAEDTVTKLDLDGLVVIGGDDSNTNACLLAENFRFVGSLYLFPVKLHSNWNYLLFL